MSQLKLALFEVISSGAKQEESGISRDPAESLIWRTTIEIWINLIFPSFDLQLLSFYTLIFKVIFIFRSLYLCAIIIDSTATIDIINLHTLY